MTTTPEGIVRLVVDETTLHRRLDGALTDFLQSDRGEEVTRSLVKKHIEEGKVTLNGKEVRKAGTFIEAGDVCTIEFVLPTSSFLGDSYVPFSVIFEDKDVLVVDKPQGITVHPGAGTKGAPTLVEGVNHYFKKDTSVTSILPETFQNNEGIRPGLVHRLDKDTSGLLIVAKTHHALVALRQNLAERTISRRYLAILHATPRYQGVFASQETGVIDLPIGRDPKSRVKMAVLEHGGRQARTRWRRLYRSELAILLEATLETGRTHQIRVHCCAHQAPLLGDEVYGRLSAIPSVLKPAVKAYNGHALHAWRLSFPHPRFKETLHFESRPSEDFCKLFTYALGRTYDEIVTPVDC
jgi:23S rRNA pseudouridine1911/1915/1917 synthase